MGTILRSRVWDLVCIFCPGHTGVRGYYRADGLASAVPVAGAITMETREIIKKIYELMLADGTTK